MYSPSQPNERAMIIRERTIVKEWNSVCHKMKATKEKKLNLYKINFGLTVDGDCHFFISWVHNM